MEKNAKDFHIAGDLAGLHQQQVQELDDQFFLAFQYADPAHCVLTQL